MKKTTFEEKTALTEEGVPSSGGLDSQCPSSPKRYTTFLGTRPNGPTREPNPRRHVTPYSDDVYFYLPKLSEFNNRSNR